jgi:hypothetical protein
MRINVSLIILANRTYSEEEAEVEEAEEEEEERGEEVGNLFKK